MRNRNMKYIHIYTYISIYKNRKIESCHKIPYYMLPLINKKLKYNQNCSLIHERYLSPLTLNRVNRISKQKCILSNDSLINSRRPRRTNEIHNAAGNNKSMRKLKKYLTVHNKQNQKSYRYIKNMEGNTCEISNHQSRGEINLATRRINTKDKPPQRYKTTMLIFRHCVLLYGGLGCQKNLTWAKLNFETMNWQIGRQTQEIKPINTYVPCSPIYGHTMVRYKENAIVYGGSYNDQINQTTIINTRSMQITQGARCPYRRKQHAAVVLNDIMIIHGGIQSRQTKSQMFVYFIKEDKWNGLPFSGLPALSGHKMVMGKSNKEMYMFGGLNAKGKSVNKLYRIRNVGTENIQIKWEAIECIVSPKPRHLFCFQRLSNNYLILYGGREDNQTSDCLEGVQNGVFNDVFTFNMDKKMWNKAYFNTNFDYCFGMASTCAQGAIFIYGGSSYSKYADAGISILWMSDQRSDPWEAIQANQYQICSSKKISNKYIN